MMLFYHVFIHCVICDLHILKKVYMLERAQLPSFICKDMFFDAGILEVSCFILMSIAFGPLCRFFI